MSPKLRDLLVALPARQLNLVVGGAIVIALLLAWTLALPSLLLAVYVFRSRAAHSNRLR